MSKQLFVLHVYLLRYPETLRLCSGEIIMNSTDRLLSSWSLYSSGEDKHAVDGLVFGWLSFLVAQMVKQLLTIRETWVPSLGWEEPLEDEMATHSSTLAWKIPWSPWCHKELDTTKQLHFGVTV